MPTDIALYNAAQSAEYKKICKKLKEVITQELKKVESKVWHGSPVWFLDGNPIVGYSVRKRGVQLLFWSGQSFTDTTLKPEGSFKAAEMNYTQSDEIKVTELRNWLKQAKRIQWDYKNIVKRRGALVKIGSW
ncbi:DUF1801 domain-containing protein [Patescibacteria group bacterium]|nr:DUF1801 domain-containing protein [Patescibacteria group bacterium]MBP9710480.1 DUF1801 domain-containing protein [Patescibacteria group bacterium]